MGDGKELAMQSGPDCADVDRGNGAAARAIGGGDPRDTDLDVHVSDPDGAQALRECRDLRRGS